MNRITVLLFGFMLLLVSGCGRGSGSGNLPSDFDGRGNAAQVAYVMKEASPDSVARFIIDAAVGRIPEARIDSLAQANLYAQEHYKGDDQELYISEFYDYKASLPLKERYRLERMLGMYDEDALGYQLGLEYVGYIRIHHEGLGQVKKEIADFRQVADAKTFQRFMTGFRVALQNDRGKDVPADIYREYGV